MTEKPVVPYSAQADAVVRGRFDPQPYIRTVKYTNRKTGEVREAKILDTAPRVAWFRSDYPIDTGWQIVTDIVQHDDQGALLKTSIISPAGIVVATAYRQVLKTAFDNYLEKAETQSVGRALERCGYGCAYALSLEPDEGEGENDNAGGTVAPPKYGGVAQAPHIGTCGEAVEPTKPVAATEVPAKLAPIAPTGNRNWWAELVKNAAAFGYDNHMHIINALIAERWDQSAMDYTHRGDILECLRKRHEREQEPQEVPA